MEEMPNTSQKHIAGIRITALDKSENFKDFVVKKKEFEISKINETFNPMKYIQRH